MIQLYFLLTIFVLSFVDSTENAVQLPDHENLACFSWRIRTCLFLFRFCYQSMTNIDCIFCC